MSNSISITCDIPANGSETFSGNTNETYGVSLSATEKGDNTILGGMDGSLVFYQEAGEKYEWWAGSPTIRKEGDHSKGGDPSSIDCDIEDYDGPELIYRWTVNAKWLTCMIVSGISKPEMRLANFIMNMVTRSG